MNDTTNTRYLSPAEQELPFMKDPNNFIRHSRTQRSRRVVAVTVLVASMLGVGTFAMSQLSVGGTQADATSISASESTKAVEEYNNAIAQDDQAKAIELAAVAEGGRRLEQQIASGSVPYADENPYAGPAVTGWLSAKPSAKSLAPEYDAVRHRAPVHNSSGEIIGYDYSYIGFVPLDLADSPAFDEHAVRFEAFGGCDPFADSNAPNQTCFANEWVKPRAK